MILILTVSSKDLLAWISFQWHKEYIKEKYCVNITNLTLDCGGVCYINNQIKENTEKESSPISNMSLNKITQIIFLIPKIEIIDYQNFTSTTLKIQIPVILLIDNPFVKGVFHPPLV
jgi:hypothetical protein